MALRLKADFADDHLWATTKFKSNQRKSKVTVSSPESRRKISLKSWERRLGERKGEQMRRNHKKTNVDESNGQRNEANFNERVETKTSLSEWQYKKDNTRDTLTQKAVSSRRQKINRKRRHQRLNKKKSDQEDISLSLFKTCISLPPSFHAEKKVLHSWVHQYIIIILERHQEEDSAVSCSDSSMMHLTQIGVRLTLF